MVSPGWRNSIRIALETNQGEPAMKLNRRFGIARADTGVEVPSHSRISDTVAEAKVGESVAHIILTGKESFNCSPIFLAKLTDIKFSLAPLSINIVEEKELILQGTMGRGLEGEKKETDR